MQFLMNSSNSSKNESDSARVDNNRRNLHLLSRKNRDPENNHNHNSSNLLPNLLPLNVYVKCLPSFFNSNICVVSLIGQYPDS